MKRIPARHPVLAVLLLAVLAAALSSVAPSGTALAHSVGRRAGIHHTRARVRCTRVHGRRVKGIKARTPARCVSRHQRRLTRKHVTAVTASRATTASYLPVPSVTLTSKPADPTTATTATFTWTTGGTVSRTVCSEDGSRWATCLSGVSYAHAKLGLNQFSVKVSNSSGAKLAYADWHVVTTTLSPPPPPPPLPPPPTGIANPFGRAMFGIAAGSTLQNESTNPALMAQDVANDTNAGARWIRIDINWAQIQYAGQGTYYWTAIDAAVQHAEAAGLQVLGTIAYTPTWARPAGQSSMYNPDPSQYAGFASAAVAHYSAMGVHTYEIWNEENISGFWHPAPNPATYTTLLKAAYPAIKAADPTATVVLGGMSPAATDGTDYSPPDFLAAIYADGGHGYFDAVGIHPYCIPAYPGDAQSWSPWYQMYGTPTNLRSLMVANGDGGKLIWGTEFGAPTNGPAGSTFVSQATQAAMITRAYQLWSTYSWAGPLFVYDGRDMGTSTSTSQNFFGLSNYDFSPKPSLRRLPERWRWD